MSLDLRSELVYLLELAQLGDLLRWHAEHWTEARDGWLVRQEQLVDELGGPRSAGLNTVAEHVDHTPPLQRDMWLALEGFLATWARASLMLFPSKRGGARARARAEHLRAILNVPEESKLGDRDLRNAWMHFDEHLDAALATGERVSRQRWVRSGEDVTGVTMRVFVPDANCIVFGERTHDLDDLFRYADSFSERVTRALETVGERHAEELSSPQPGEY